LHGQQLELTRLVAQRSRELEDKLAECLRLEQNLHAAQKMEAVGQLAAGTAHYFNNLLTVIQMEASLLSEGVLNRAELAERAAAINQASLRAADLVNQLLAFSRRQMVFAEPLDLNEVLRQQTPALTQLLGDAIQLQVLCQANLPRIQADARLLEQVITSLAANAREAMPQGGHLCLATGTELLTEAGAAQRPEVRSGPYVTLTVTDDGVGMKPAVLQHLFEPFFTTKAIGQGVGLSLAAVYGILHQHRGWVEVSSQPGQGSTFKLWLPVSPAASLGGKKV
jgi:signal transduction histidine kinase